MTNGELLQRVLAIVCRVAGPGRTPSDVGPDTPLADGGFWLDSVKILEVLVACEAEFGPIFYSETTSTETTLQNVRSLAAIIQTRMSAAE